MFIPFRFATQGFSLQYSHKADLPAREASVRLNAVENMLWYLPETVSANQESVTHAT